MTIKHFYKLTIFAEGACQAAWAFTPVISILIMAGFLATRKLETFVYIYIKQLVSEMKNQFDALHFFIFIFVCRLTHDLNICDSVKIMLHVTVNLNAAGFYSLYTSTYKSSV